MKRAAAILTGLIIAILMVPLVASAQVINHDQSKGDRTRVESGQTIDDDLYITGRTIVIEGTVNGDVYAAGSSITIRGTVNGDVFAAGQDILIGGTVTGSARLAGSTIRLNNPTIGGSVTSFSQNLNIENNTKIGGGLNFAGDSVEVRGSVGRGILGAASDVTLGGSVGKDVGLSASTITLASTAALNGGLTYYGESNLKKDNGAQVNGQTKHLNEKPAHKDSGRSTAWEIIWGILSLYAVGALLLWLVPGLLLSAASAITSRPGASLGYGLLALLLVLPLFIVLLITIIGIPLALIMLIIFAIMVYLSKFVAALAIGSLIAGRTGWKPNPYADAIVGLLLITIVELIPGIGWLIKLAIVIFGLGAFIVSRLPHRSRPATTTAK
jgi:cytoskeletal protein CcmA (bactofilin family)